MRRFALCLILMLLIVSCGSGLSDEDIEALVAERVEEALAEQEGPAEATSPDPAPSTLVPSSTTTTTPESEPSIPDGSRQSPYPFSCTGSLEDGWHDVASMPESCVAFRLQSRGGDAGCVYAVSSGRADREAIKRVVGSWAGSVTEKSLGSVLFWGTVPVKFDNCQMVKPVPVSIRDLEERVTGRRQRSQHAASVFERKFSVNPVDAVCTATPEPSAGIETWVATTSSKQRLLHIAVDRSSTWTVTVRCKAPDHVTAHQQVSVVIRAESPPRTTTAPSALSYRAGWRTRVYEDPLTGAKRMYATVDGDWQNAEFPYEDNTPRLSFFCTPGSRNLTVYVAGLSYIAASWRSGVPVGYRINNGPAQYERWSELNTNEGAWGGTSSLLPRNIEQSGADSASLYVQITNFDSTEERLSFTMSKASDSITALRDACERGRF